MKKTFASLFRRPAETGPLDESSHPKSYFTQVFLRNYWGGKLSKSGPGSEGEPAKQKVAILKQIITGYKVFSVLDLGCGDFYWMQEIAPLVGRYHGVDVVEPLIDANRKRFGGAQVSFQRIDLSDPRQQQSLLLRNVDLVVCLDVLGHLLNKEVDSLMRFIFYDVQARFFLVTNRREEGSVDYLKREKTRFEGIDIEQHPLFLERHPRRLKQIPGLYPNDFFVLYELT